MLNFVIIICFHYVFIKFMFDHLYCFSHNKPKKCYLETIQIVLLRSATPKNTLVPRLLFIQ